MAYRALLFSKDPETNSALVSGCLDAGLRSDSCSDIFTAIKKGTKQSYSCVIVDWADQPEAGFLLKRTRESASNSEVVVIAIVDHDPTPAELRDHGLHFFIYRSIAATEAKEVLTKAMAKMQPSVDADRPDTTDLEETPREASVDATPAEPEPSSHEPSPQPVAEMQEDSAEQEGGESGVEDEHDSFRPAFSWRHAAAAALLLFAAYSLWNARAMMTYLARTPESKAGVFKESLAAFFNLSPAGTAPLSVTGSDAHQDAYYSRGPASSTTTTTPEIAVVATQADLVETRVILRGPADFPLPEATYTPPPPVPVHTERAAIPDSLRGSAPLTKPVVVTVNPTQMMPVSAPMTPPLVTQGFSEPVAVSEDEQRGLLIHSVNPLYPPEALPQKMHGAVVLQATIGRDGTVEDLKIMRGYIVLGKAAIAAVKQWRFKPYTVDGHAAQTRTTITVSFNLPPA